jgi:predicted nucleic acid-binding protein
MNGHRFLADTNMLIMLVDGNERVAELLEGCQIFTSFISELELLSASGLMLKQIKKLESLLADCTIIDINPAIKSSTLEIRRKHKVKLPDAIVAATAITLDLPLLTADHGFKRIDGLTIILFEI